MSHAEAAHAVGPHGREEEEQHMLSPPLDAHDDHHARRNHSRLSSWAHKHKVKRRRKKREKKAHASDFMDEAKTRAHIRSLFQRQGGFSIASQVRKGTAMTQFIKKTVWSRVGERLHVGITLSKRYEARLSPNRLGLGRFLESHAMQATVLFLLLLDVLVVIAELILEAEAARSPSKGVILAEEILHWTSVGILCCFAMELVLLMLAFGHLFFSHRLYVVDLFVVTVSLVADVLLSDVLGSLQVVLVLLRLWRVVRVVHGIVATMEEKGAHDKLALRKARLKLALMGSDLRRCIIIKKFYKKLLSDHGIPAEHPAGLDKVMHSHVKLKRSAFTPEEQVVLDAAMLPMDDAAAELADEHGLSLHSSSSSSGDDSGGEGAECGAAGEEDGIAMDRARHEYAPGAAPSSMQVEEEEGDEEEEEAGATRDDMHTAWAASNAIDLGPSRVDGASSSHLPDGLQLHVSSSSSEE